MEYSRIREECSALIIKELKDVQKDFGDARRTEIRRSGRHQPGRSGSGRRRRHHRYARGYLKRTSVDTYRKQSRGGKGRIGMGTRSEDIVEHLLVGSTHSYILVFTSKGRLYWLKVYEIPEAAAPRAARPSTI